MKNETITEPTLRMGSRIEVPVGALTKDYKKLLKSLTVTNPEYTNAALFGMGKVSPNIPEKLFFFEVNAERKSLLLPRNIDSSYYRGKIDYSGLSVGSEICKAISPKFKLRDRQKDYLEKEVISRINNIYNNNINNNTINKPIDILLDASCGSGKTLMSLYLSNLYKRKTLVVVTQRKIGQQFVTEVKEHFPKWTVGWVEDNKEYDITIGTYSLLSKPRYGENYFKNFGHTILDEFHRCGADTYACILDKCSSIYRTSMTATFRRKDGLHKMLAHHAGEVITMERDELKATIYPIRTGVEINEYLFRGIGRFPTHKNNIEEYQEVAVRTASKDKKLRMELDRGMIVTVEKDSKGAAKKFTLTSGITKQTEEFNTKDVNVFKLTTISAPILETEVSEYENRNDMILELVKTCVANGRRIIVLSKRKDQLFTLAGRMRRKGIDNAVVASEKSKEYKDYCKRNGRTVEENREYAFNESRVILGIDKIAQEGMDAPKFDTLLILYPIKDIEQSIGRILREREGKKDPIGLYLLDKTSVSHKAFYGKTGAGVMFAELGHTLEDDVSYTDFIKKFKNGEI